MVAAALPAVTAPAAAAAQEGASLSAGVSNVRYADTVSVLATTIAPAWRYTGAHLALSAAGAFSHLALADGIGAWTSQGDVAGSALTGALGPLRGEVAGRGGMSAHQDGTRTGQWRALGRLHAMRPATGLWVGGGAGRTWDGVRWRDVRLAEAGLWWRGARGTAAAVATPISVGMADGSAIRYTDVELTAGWTAGRLALAGSFGARAGDAAAVAPSEARSWGSATATLRLAGPLSLVASGGSYPVDFAQGFPGGRFLSLAVGVTPRRAAPLAAPTGVEAGAAVTAFRVEAPSSGPRRVRVRAPRAARLELAGDFSGWEPVALRRAGGGWWETELALPAGTYQLAVRADGGAWGAPPGLVEVVDEFGGRAGVLVLP